MLHNHFCFDAGSLNSCLACIWWAPFRQDAWKVFLSAQSNTLCFLACPPLILIHIFGSSILSFVWASLTGFSKPESGCSSLFQQQLQTPEAGCGQVDHVSPCTSPLLLTHAPHHLFVPACQPGRQPLTVEFCLPFWNHCLASDEILSEAKPLDSNCSILCTTWIT